MVKIALRVAVLAAIGLTGGCYYAPYGYGPYGYRYAYPGYAYRPAPVVVYPGGYYR